MYEVRVCSEIVVCLGMGEKLDKEMGRWRHPIATGIRQYASKKDHDDIIMF
jgi:hypothetical protein